MFYFYQSERTNQFIYRGKNRVHKRRYALLVCVIWYLTLSFIVGRSWMRMKRKATTGRIQRRVVRNMVSHTLGWLREFLAVPGESHSERVYRYTILQYCVWVVVGICTYLKGLKFNAQTKDWNSYMCQILEDKTFNMWAPASFLPPWISWI